jgi:hypothetical protein
MDEREFMFSSLTVRDSITGLVYASSSSVRTITINNCRADNVHDSRYQQIAVRIGSSVLLDNTQSVAAKNVDSNAFAIVAVDAPANRFVPHIETLALQ